MLKLPPPPFDEDAPPPLGDAPNNDEKASSPELALVGGTGLPDEGVGRGAGAVEAAKGDAERDGRGEGVVVRIDER